MVLGTVCVVVVVLGTVPPSSSITLFLAATHAALSAVIAAFWAAVGISSSTIAALAALSAVRSVVTMFSSMDSCEGDELLVDEVDEPPMLVTVTFVGLVALQTAIAPITVFAPPTYVAFGPTKPNARSAVWIVGDTSKLAIEMEPVVQLSSVTGAPPLIS